MIAPRLLTRLIRRGVHSVSYLRSDLQTRVNALSLLGNAEPRILDDLSHLLRDYTNKQQVEVAPIPAAPNSLEFYNNRVLECAQQGNVPQSLNYIQEMMERSLQPNVDTYSHMILCYGNAKNSKEVQNWFEVYRNSDEPTSDAPYINLISAFISCSDIPAAINVMSTIMAEDSVTLTSVHIQTFMDALFRHGYYRKILEWYKRIATDSSGQFPKLTTPILNTVFDTAVFLKDSETIKKVWPLLTNSEREIAAQPTNSATPEKEWKMNPIALSQYGLWRLAEKDWRGAFESLKLLSLNSEPTYPVLPVFLLEIMDPKTRKMFKGMNLHHEDQFSEVDRMALEVAVNRGCPRVPFLKIWKHAIINAGGDVVVAINAYKKGLSLYGSIHGRPSNELLSCYMEHGRMTVSRPNRSYEPPQLTVEDFELLYQVAAESSPEDLRKVNEDFKIRKLEATRLICDSVADVLRKRQNREDLGFWLEAMRRRGVLVGPAVDGEFITFERVRELNAHILRAVRQGRVDEAMTYYNDIATSKYSPSVQASGELLAAVVVQKGLEEANRIGNSLLERATDLKDEKQRIFVIHDSILRGIFRIKDLPNAFAQAKLLMDTCERPPSVQNVNRLLAAVEYEDSAELKAQLYLQASGVILQIISMLEVDLNSEKAIEFMQMFPEFIRILMKTDQHNRAMSLYQMLRDAKKYIPIIVIRAVFQWVVEHGSRVQAMEMLDELLRDRKSAIYVNNQDDCWGNQASDRIDGSFIRLILKMTMSRFKDADAAMSLWNLFMIEKRVHADEATFCLMIDGLMEAAKFEDAIRLLIAMRRANFKMPITLVENLFGSEKGFQSVLSLSGDDVKELGYWAVESSNSQYTAKPSAFVVESLIKLGISKDFSGLVDELAVIMVDSFDGPSSTLLGNEIIGYMSEKEYYKGATTVLESMKKSRSDDSVSNRRNLESFKALIYAASKNKNNDAVEYGFSLMGNDEVPSDEIASIRDSLKKFGGETQFA